MNIAFLTDKNSIHVNIKAKYFENIPETKFFFFAVKLSIEDYSRKVSQQFNKKMQIILLEQDDLGFKETLKNIKKLKEIIKKEKIQLVHINDMKFYNYGILLKTLGVKVVLENNGSDVLRTPQINPKVKKWYRLAYFLCDGVTQDSKVAQDMGIALGAKKKNNLIIELGIDYKIFNLNLIRGFFRKKYDISADSKVIFSPRAFRNLYNIGDIIKTIPVVIKKYPDVKYVFCSYVQNPQWMRLIKKLQVEPYVIMLGYLDNEKEMPYIYADSDVVISIPSSDSSPRTVYEAMACGCTTIVSDLPWIKGKFLNGRELWTTPVKDVPKLTSLLLDILNEDKKIDCVKSSKRIYKLLDYKKSAVQLINLYRKILNEK